MWMAGGIARAGSAFFENPQRQAGPKRALGLAAGPAMGDRKSTRLNSSHSQISYAVFCLKKKKQQPSTIFVPRWTYASSLGHVSPPYTPRNCVVVFKFFTATMCCSWDRLVCDIY